jgi:putative transposase
MVTQGFPVQVCCRVLEVSQSGFYAWRSRPPSARAIRHAWLTGVIRQVHASSRQTYGSRRVHAELTLGGGISVGYHAVELLMRRAGLQGVTGGPSSDVACDRKPPPGIWSTASSPAPAVTSCG